MRTGSLERKLCAYAPLDKVAPETCVCVYLNYLFPQPFPKQLVPCFHSRIAELLLSCLNETDAKYVTVFNSRILYNPFSKDTFIVNYGSSSGK